MVTGIVGFDDFCMYNKNFCNILTLLILFRFLLNSDLITFVVKCRFGLHDFDPSRRSEREFLSEFPYILRIDAGSKCCVHTNCGALMSARIDQAF